jgi:hypothetical protein
MPSLPWENGSVGRPVPSNQWVSFDGVDQVAPG